MEINNCKIKKKSKRSKRPQRCIKLQKNLYTITQYNYDDYHDDHKNDSPANIINAINRIYYMTNLPYNQKDSYQSTQFEKLSIINLIDTPSLILQNIISYLDLKSIYMLSRTCWKMLLFSRTNIIANHILFKYKNIWSTFDEEYRNNKYHFMRHMKKYYGFYNHFYEILKQPNFTTKKINIIVNKYNNPYGYQIYKHGLHIIEVLLFGYKYLVFTQAFEYTIKQLFNNIVSIYNLFDINDLLDKKLKEISCAFCNKKCVKNNRYYDNEHKYIYYKNTKNINEKIYYFPNIAEKYENIEYYYDDKFKYDYVLDL